MLTGKPIILLLVLLLFAGLAACDGDNPTPTLVPPTATPAPAPATAADLRLIRNALTDAQTLERFHFRVDIATEGMTETSTLEGDFIAPDNMYEHTTNSTGTEFEHLYRGNKAYEKQNGVWVSKPASTDQTELLQKFSAIVAADLYSYTQVVDVAIFDTRRTETIVGTPTHVYSYSLTIKAINLQTVRATPVQAAATVGRVAGTGTLWIDPATGHLHKLEVHLDFALRGYVSQLQAWVEAGNSARLTRAVPTPPLSRITTDTLTLSRHNDPAITIPTP
jgi:hypothetical protein